MCIFFPRPLLGSIIFSVVAWFFRLVTLQKHQLSEAVTLGGTPLAACGSAWPGDPDSVKQPVHTHLPVIDSQNALSLWGAVFLGLNDLDGPGVVMCTQKAVCHIFPFQSYELHLNRIKIFFFHLQDFSLSDFSTCPLCYIRPEWAISGIVWNRRWIRCLRGTRQGGRSLSLLSSKDVFSLPDGQLPPQYQHLRQCSLPAASTFVILIAAFNGSLTGQCWENFSDLRIKSKAKQLYGKWVRAISYLPLEGNAFYFSLDKWEGRQAIVGKR